MAASFTLPTVLANLAAGNQALSLIDGDLTTLRDPLLSLNTFSNFYTDTGAANAYVITVTSPQAVTQSAGLRVQFLAAHANTGASTLQINALAAKSVLNLNGSALLAGQIPTNGIVDVMYDGTQYLLLTPAATVATQSDQETATSTATFVSPGRQQFHPSAAKAWVSWTGGSTTILASYNVTSITNNGVGDATVNFTTAFSTANYGLAGWARDAANNFPYVCGSTATTPATGSCRVRQCNGANAAADASVSTVAFFGDQ